MQEQKRIGLTLRILGNQLRRAVENQIAATMQEEVTFWQGRIIGFIRMRSQSGDVFQRDIEQEFDIRRSTATGMLKLLEKNGLLTRQPVEYDARMKRIILTPRALEIHDALVQEIDRVEAQIASGLTPEEIRTFFAITEKIAAAIGAGEAHRP